MNGANSSVSDRYVQEFVLDTFSNVAIKPEIICPNLTDDAAGAAPTPSVSLPEDDLLLRHTPDSVIMSHSQMPHRLPSMSLLHSQASPPPHLLTPPESQEDYYPPLPHHSMMTGSLMKNCNLIIPGNLPDTPPISSPPLPSAIYHHLEHHHQYPPSLQALHHLHQPSSDVAEEMMWLSQSADLPPRQEPLDLRPHGDSWNIMQQQHTSVITGPGKRIYHTDYFHHQASLGQYPAGGQLPSLSPLQLTNSTSPSASSSSSLSLSLTTTAKSLVAHNSLESQARGMNGRARNCSRGRAKPGAAGKMAGANASNGHIVGKERPQNEDIKINDDLLLKINVRDLNVKLKGTTKDEQAKTKQRRRTLKNRIYAQNCRNKRNDQKTKLEIAKIQLEEDLKAEQRRVDSLQKDVTRTQHELARERQMVNALRNEIGKLHSDLELLQQKLRETVAKSAPNISRCSSANLITKLSVSSSVGEY